MKKIIFQQLFLGLIVSLFSGFTLIAQNAITGNVQDESGQPLPGANVLIKGTSQGTTTDFDGNFTVNNSSDSAAVLVISYTGFSSQEIEVSAGSSDLTIILKEDFASLDEVVISASRKPEKAIDAIASISVINDKKIASAPISGEVNDLIRNVVGVQLVKNGIGESNVELRGSATVNETNVLVMKDYQPMTSIGTKRVNSAAVPLTPIDIARVEVVRGPAGALYGPNVTSGVVHYITKDPFKYTGVDVYGGTGNQGQSQLALRYANHSKNKKFGYKLLVKSNQADEFQISGEGLLQSDGATPIIIPGTKTLADGSTINVGDNLYQETYSHSYEATLMYKFNENTSITYVGSINNYAQNYRNQTTHLYNAGRSFLNQFRISAGNFFATVYAEKNFGNESLPEQVFSFNYTRGDETASTTKDDFYYDITAQYNIDFGENTNLTLGGDIKMIPDFVDPRRFGVNSGENAYNVYGGYFSLKHKFSEKLSLSAVARYDDYQAYGQGAWSPRLGIVYKPTEISAIRFSVNRSFSAESQVRTFLDFTFPTPAALPEAHAVGVSTAVTYNSPVTQFAFGRVQGGDSFALADIIDALAANAGVTVNTSGVSGDVTPSLVAASFRAPQIGAPGGPINSLADAGSGSAQLRTVNSIELGYTNVFNEKFKFNLDAYYSVTQNIQPAGITGLSAGARLDVAAVGGQIQTALAGASVPQATIDQLITVLGRSAPGPPRPGYGLIISDVAQANGYLHDSGFPTYGNEDVAFFGVDLGLNYYVNSDFSLFGNYSHVTKNVWDSEDLKETNPNFEYYLNTPSNRFNLGVNYLPKKGFYTTLAVNSQSEFDGKQGDARIFTGTNDARTIVDMSLGYRFNLKGDSKMDLGLSINNLLNEEYRFFVNLPTITRTTLFTLKYHL